MDVEFVACDAFVKMNCHTIAMTFVCLSVCPSPFDASIPHFLFYNSITAEREVTVSAKELG